MYSKFIFNFIRNKQVIFQFSCTTVYSCWRRSRKGHDSWLSCKLDSSNLRLLTLFPEMYWNVLRCINTFPPPFPTVDTVPRAQPWESKVLLRPCVLCMWLNPGVEIYSSLPRASLASKFSCLLNCQQLSFSFFGISLPSVHWGGKGEAPKFGNQYVHRQCERILTVELINTSSTLHSYLFFFCVKNT